MVRYDVAVIGGGLIGCAASYYLARKGLSVALIERGQINRQASGRNAGSLHFQLEHRLIRQGVNASIAPLLALSRTAIEDWQQLPDQLNADLEVSMPGGLMLAAGPDDEALLQAKQALENDHGIASSILTTEELNKRAPYIQNPGITAAAWLATEGSANPRLLTPAYRSAAEQFGVTNLVGHTLQAAELQGDNWQLYLATLEEGYSPKVSSLFAQCVLLATGSDIDRTAATFGHSLPMNQLPLLMNISSRAKPTVDHFIQHVSKDLSLKQVAAGNVIIGGGWPAQFKMLNGKPDRSRMPEIIPEHVAGNIGLALSLVPALTNTSLLRTWTGVAGTTPDDLPYLGTLCDKSGLYVAGGGSAFTLGPTMARFVSDVIAGEKVTQDLSPFDPKRLQKPLKT